MATADGRKLDLLYETDETAWLELMATLAAEGRLEELDGPNLSEYLESMAQRDRREVVSRLVVLLIHLLKAGHQPERSGGSWRATIREQRRELRLILDSRTLRNHAEEVWADIFADARLQAADETGPAVETFPTDCPWDLDTALTGPLS